MFLISLAAAIIQAVGVLATTAPIGRGSLGSYISPDDYPQGLSASAARAVSVVLVVGPDGRVTDCTVREGSGSSLLDATTCRLLRNRTHFTPATSAGVPTAGEVRTTIDWPAIRSGTPGARTEQPPFVRTLPDPPVITVSVGGAPPVEVGRGGARAQANLASLVNSSDYPAEAVRAGEQGTTGFLLAVGPNGSVTDCNIMRSSGSAILDAATCRLMTSRARFTPALDANGKPTSDTVSARIAWRLPSQSIVVPDLTIVRFAIGADGKTRDCTLFAESVGRTQEAKSPDCGPRPPDRAVVAAMRAAGGQGALRVRVETRLLREASQPWPKLEQSGLKIIGFDLVRLRVAPGGRVLNCFVLERQSGGLPPTSPCRPTMQVPGYTADREAEMRVVTFAALEETN